MLLPKTIHDIKIFIFMLKLANIDKKNDKCTLIRCFFVNLCPIVMCTQTK